MLRRLQKSLAGNCPVGMPITPLPANGGDGVRRAASCAMNGSLHDPLRNGGPAPYAGNGGAANGHDRPRDEFRSSLVKTVS